MGRSFETDIRYRTVEERQILEFLLVHAWVYEVRRGRCAAALKDAAQVLDRWVNEGLPFRTTDRGRYFDPAEVINFLKWIGVYRGDPFWRERFISTGRRLILEHHGLDTRESAPPDPKDLPPAHFSLRFSREFNLKDRTPGTRVFLRLPLPLEDETLSDVRIEHAAPPGVAVEFSPAPGRLDARLAVPPERRVTLGLRAAFVAKPMPCAQTGTLAPTDVELYTRPGEGLVQLSPRIRALAARLTQGVKEPHAIIRRFWNFLLDEMNCGMIHYDALDALYPTDWPLEHGWVDCQLGSALLVALCRAQSVPARIVSGYLLYPESPFHHYWAEAWVDGQWFPMDLICADLSANGQDAAWRDHFFGRVDYRVKTQCLPRLFNTTPTVRLPPSWQILASTDDEGIQTELLVNDSGDFLYRDRFSVEKVKAAPL